MHRQEARRVGAAREARAEPVEPGAGGRRRSESFGEPISDVPGQAQAARAATRVLGQLRELQASSPASTARLSACPARSGARACDSGSAVSGAPREGLADPGALGPASSRVRVREVARRRHSTSPAHGEPCPAWHALVSWPSAARRASALPASPARQCARRGSDDGSGRRGSTHSGRITVKGAARLVGCELSAGFAGGGKGARRLSGGRGRCGVAPELEEIVRRVGEPPFRPRCGPAAA